MSRKTRRVRCYNTMCIDLNNTTYKKLLKASLKRSEKSSWRSAVINVVISVLLILLGIFGLTSGGDVAYLCFDVEIVPDSSSVSDLKGATLTMNSIQLIVWGVVGLLLAVLVLILLKAADKNARKCKVLFVLNLVGLVLMVIGPIWSASFGTITPDTNCIFDL